MLYTDLDNLISGLLHSMSHCSCMVRHYNVIESHLIGTKYILRSLSLLLLTNASGMRPSMLSLEVKTFSVKAISYCVRFFFIVNGCSEEKPHTV